MLIVVFDDIPNRFVEEGEKCGDGSDRAEIHDVIDGSGEGERARDESIPLKVLFEASSDETLRRQGGRDVGVVATK